MSSAGGADARADVQPHVFAGQVGGEFEVGQVAGGKCRALGGDAVQLAGCVHGALHGEGFGGVNGECAVCVCPIGFQAA